LTDWDFDYESPNYVDNWIQEMGMMCYDRAIINWIVVVYYLAYGVAGLLFWRVPDLYGFRQTLLVFGTTHLISQWIMLLVPDYIARQTSFIIMGLS